MQPTPPGDSRLVADPPSADEMGGALPEGMAAPARVAVVRNPRSHRNRGAATQVCDAPDVIAIAPRDRQELTEALRRFAAWKIELLVVDGGDGTMRDVLTCGATAFGDNWPKLVILPKGKTNALAVDVEMPDHYTLQEALDGAENARVIVRRPILVEHPESGKAVLGFILGAGVFNAAIAAGQVAHRFGAFQGFAVAVTALFAVFQALFGIGQGPWRTLSGIRLRRCPEGQEVPRSDYGAPGKRFAAAFSTLQGFPLGMRPFGDAGEGIRYLLVDAPLRRVMPLVPPILMGFDRAFLPRLGVHRGAADEFELDLDGSFILDGEAFPPGSYRLRLGPELHFLAP
jgi:diacylglycerol kinase (ATP)